MDADRSPEPSPQELEEIEAILNALRQWLLESGALRLPSLSTDGKPDGDLAGGDLHSLARELTALRADVRLEAKGTKAIREKLEETAESIERGLERMREGAIGAAEEALIEAIDALRRGQKATEEIRRRLGWRGWLLPRGLLEGLLEGYSIAARKLERTLESLGVREMRCAGESFDPLRMKVVETEVRAELPEGHVIEVIRPGYMKAERVVRFAEVKTAVRGTRGAGNGWKGSEVEKD